MIETSFVTITDDASDQAAVAEVTSLISVPEDISDNDLEDGDNVSDEEAAFLADTER